MVGNIPAGTTAPRGLPPADRIRWPLFPCRDLFKLTYGKALVESLRNPGEVPVYGTNGRCGSHDVPLFRGPGVIIGRKGQGPLGVEWTDNDYWVIDTAYSLSPRRDDIDLKYSYYLIKHVGLNHLKDGTSNPTLSRESFGSQALPLPPLPMQRAIAHIVSTLDDKIELNRRRNQTLEAMARTLFQDWFVDFGPVRAKMEGREPYLPTDLWQLFPDYLNGVGQPDGWEKKRVSDFLTLAYGKSLPAGKRNHGTIPVYGSGGITGFHDEALINGPVVIVGRKGTVGSLYWENRPCFPIDTVFYVQPEAPLSFCYYLLESLPLRDMNTDAAVPGLNRENVYRLEVAAPPAELISAFARTAARLRERIAAISRESETLSDLRDTLLPKLISGELRIPDFARHEELAS